MTTIDRLHRQAIVDSLQAKITDARLDRFAEAVGYEPASRLLSDARGEDLNDRFDMRDVNDTTGWR